MFHVERIDEYLRVAGYPDGSEWWVPLPHARDEFSYGIVGPGHVWYFERSGCLHILRADTRVQASVQLADYSPVGGRVPVTASRDGRRLYVVEWLAASPAGQARVHVVDVAAGAVSSVLGPLPARFGAPPHERPDGRLLLPTLRQSLVLLDPATGEWTESAVPGAPGAGNFWAEGSPDGRYWIRFDPGTLPVHQPAPGFLDRIRQRKKIERRYGLTLQIWEAFPLRFLTKTVAAWLAVDEMPDETQLARSRQQPAALPSRRALWDAVAAARPADAGPFDPPPSRSAYQSVLAADDGAWHIVEKNLAKLEGWIAFVAWQPDGDAVWVSTNGFLSCVGIDGQASPRLYTERFGLEGGTWLPVAARGQEVVPLTRRTARVVYTSGTVVFDGAPSATPYSPHAIPATRDRWQPAPGDSTARDREVARKLEALREERRRIVIPLVGWSESGCVAAIDALTKQVSEDVSGYAVSHEIRIVFASGEGDVSEERFFTEAGARFPAIAPAIRRLIDRYCGVAKRNDYLFSQGDEGIGLFAWAVRALGVLDRSALPTLRRYGVFVDVEHEYYFAGTTVPAVVQAHGWTDDVVDFVFWVLAWHYYNTLTHYGEVWVRWGLRDAVVHREPRAFARHIAADLAETMRMKDDPGRYGIAGLDKLADEIPQPHEPWAAAFFDELERIFAEPVEQPG